jgi:hypothetical protein
MIRQLPAATVEAVVDYAHRKAAYYFYDDWEELQQFNITEKVAYYIYCGYFITAIMDVIKGQDSKCTASCPSRNIPLVALASGIKQREYRSEVLSQSLLQLRIKVNDVEYSFENMEGGYKILRIDDYHVFEFDSWKESILDFMGVISQHCDISYASRYFIPLIQKFRQASITKNIMCETAEGIIKARLEGEDYRITLRGADENENTVTFWIDTSWGEIRIGSPLESFDDALTSTIEEVKQSSAMW